MERPRPTEECVKPLGLWGELGLLLHHKDILRQQLGQNCIICLRHISPALQPDTKMFKGDAALPSTPERCLPGRVLSHPGIVLGAAFLRQVPKVKDVLF